MARKPSVILTPTEKKAALADAKAALKTAKAEHAKPVSERKAATSAYQKEAKAAADAFSAKLKVLDRTVQTAEKNVTAAERAVLTLAPPAADKAVPSPTE